MKIVAPKYLQDYAPGFSMFTLNTASIISNGIAWFENMDEALEFQGNLPINIYKTGASHVVSVVDKNWGIEAAERGVKRVMLAEYFEDKNMLVVCREPQQMHDAYSSVKLKWQLDQEGAGYDYLSLFGHALAITSGLQNLFPFLRKLPPVGHVPGRWVCSSFEAEGFKQVLGYAIEDLYHNWNVHRIHVHRLWNEFPYRPFRLDKQRKGEKYEKINYAF